ncbi:MAG: cupin domain-containing protein [Acidobacteriota bacterium]|nr:cupin domain-containing protein [Acidobacteriota bacterium]
MPLTHPSVILPAAHAVYSPAKMGKATLFESPRLLVGLNAFEPGQAHALHAHAGMDKVYYVLEGEGLFLLEGQDLPMRAGQMLVAPDGVPHGVRNTGATRLLVLAVLAGGRG